MRFMKRQFNLFLDNIVIGAQQRSKLFQGLNSSLIIVKLVFHLMILHFIPKYYHFASNFAPFVARIERLSSLNLGPMKGPRFAWHSHAHKLNFIIRLIILKSKTVQNDKSIFLFIEIFLSIVILSHE